MAAARTPARCRAVVLGCTHYPLVVDEIRAALPPGTVLLDSSRAVAGQALRRLGVAEELEQGGHVREQGRAQAKPVRLQFPQWADP